MTKAYHLDYIGDIRSLDTCAHSIGFVTQHVEARPTAVYLVDAQTNKLSSIALPCGGLSIRFIDDGKQLAIGGDDGLLYIASAKQLKAAPAKHKFSSPVKRIGQLSDGELLCLTNTDVVIVDLAGKPIQTVSLVNLIDDQPNPTATSIGSSSDGRWLAIGFDSGHVAVFEREPDTNASNANLDETEFKFSEVEKLHGGEVTALLFDADELRFYSAAADHKFLVTHARGKLEPEDRGRGNGHTDRVTALLLAGQSRLISSSLDKTCKTWVRTANTKPATLKEGLVATVDIGLAAVHQRTTLVAAQADASIRLFLIDEDGKFGQSTARYNDGYSNAKQLFESTSPADRGAGLHCLANYDDARSLDLLAERIVSEPDNQLRVTATELLTKSSHARAGELLLKQLDHHDHPIRELAFSALLKLQSSSLEHLELCESAIATKHADIGCAAVSRLEELSQSKSESDAFRNRACDLLVRSFENKTAEIRRSAILALESVFDKQSSRPSLIALQSNNADARRISLIRLLQRQLLSDNEATAGLRRAIEDRDATVRRTAALILMLTEPELTTALRQRDDDLDRQLSELESSTVADLLTPTEADKAGKKPGGGDGSKTNSPTSKTGKLAKAKGTGKSAAKSKSKSKVKSKATQNELAKVSVPAAALQPLLIMASSRAMDTCLLGARCLALLQDPRAFGILMQLSREQDNQARVEVCRALASLNDQRANERLRSLLADSAIEVRDAAYTALVSLRSTELLAAAADGLTANADDVRLRALETLVSQIKKSSVATKKLDHPATLLLRQALNDSAAGVRSEAFKVALNSRIGGDEATSLRFSLNSIHADVRREVLTEAMALHKQPWAGEMLLDLLDDPAREIRNDAFEFIKKQAKDSELEWLADAVKRRYVDVRRSACETLVKRRTNAAQAILASAIDDSDDDLRAFVLESLVDANQTDTLLAALASRHDDVRLGAACALAKLGRTEVKSVLLEAIAAEKPKDAPLVERWSVRVRQALLGLAQLGDNDTLPTLLSHIQNDDPEIRQMAAWALAWVVRETTVDEVLPLLRHDDEPVRSNAAFAVTLAGSEVGLPIVFSADAKSIEPIQRLVAAFVLGDDSGRLVEQLNVDQPEIANAAFLLLLIRDWKTNDGTPQRMVDALAASPPAIRLAAAEAVESFLAPDDFAELVSGRFNQRPGRADWKINTEEIETVAAMLLHGDRRLAGRLIWRLTELESEKQHGWDETFGVLRSRFESEIGEAVAAFKQTPTAKSTSSNSGDSTPSDQDVLDQLAFGTYIGLVREQGSQHQRRQKSRFGASIIDVRCAAIRRLLALHQRQPELGISIESVLTQTASDPNQEVRRLAFETLADLGVTDDSRAAIAMETGHRDLAVAGLALLMQSGTKAAQVKLLENVIRTRNDEIALEAAKLLRNLIDVVKLCDICFDSPYLPLPKLSTSWLAAEFEESSAARKRIRELAGNAEDGEIRRLAIETLVAQHDEEAFTALQLIFAREDEPVRNSYLPQFSFLRDPETATFLISQLRANVLLDARNYFQQIANTRQPEVTGELFELAVLQPKWREPIFDAAIRISGYDQPITDPNDLQSEQTPKPEEYSRHDDVLAMLIEEVNRNGKASRLKSLVACARWAKSPAVNDVLASLVVHPDEKVRHAAVEAVGFRGEKRGMSLDSLAEALIHRDPVTKFLAAEALAKSSDARGISILLSSVELVTDLRLRRRAVLALGRLSDERAFALLFKLVSDDGHALQDSAAEAIGRLRVSDKRDAIFKSLKSLVNQDSTAGARAIVGLRHLDDTEGWSLIRERASKVNPLQLIAIAQLGYSDDSATQDLLLKLLCTASAGAEGLLESARRSCGENSVLPELAWLEGAAKSGGTDQTVIQREAILQKIRELATPEQIIEVLPRIADDDRRELVVWLVHLDPLPETLAAKQLNHAQPTIVDAAAWLLGRSASTKHSAIIAQTLERWCEELLSADRVYDSVARDEHSRFRTNFQNMRNCVSRLAWAAGVLGGQETAILKIINATTDSPRLRSLRRAASQTLAHASELTASTLEQIKELVSDSDPQVRGLAGEVISRLGAGDGKKRSNADLARVAEQALPDATLFRKLAAAHTDELKSVLQSCAARPHYQSRSLRQLIELADVETLESVAVDTELPLATRMGAIEGLAQIGKPSEKALIGIGKDEQADEELRKAAWRALRRAKRKQTTGSA